MEVPMMMDTELPLELTKAIAKAEKIDERNVQKAGYGASDVGMQIAQTYIGRTIEAVELELLYQEQKNPQDDLATVLGGLSVEVLALCGLTSVIHGIATSLKQVEVYALTGAAVKHEAWAAGFLIENPKLFAKLDTEARKRQSTVERRRIAARAMARRKGYLGKLWPRDVTVRAGAWLTNAVIRALPEVFMWAHDAAAGHYFPAVCEGAMEAAQEAAGEAVFNSPVNLPRPEKPHPWTSWRNRHVDPRINGSVTFLRTYHGDVIAASKTAIANGAMKPALDAVTTLQSVPWRINKRIYGVIRGCMTRGIEVAGLPTGKELAEVVQSKPYDQMTDLEQKLWRIERDEAEKQNMAIRGERLSLIDDMEVAAYLLDMESFYTTMNCDWRGRVYAVPHFNFQREDRVRAMFEFADGEPIGEDGLRWLQMQVANCWGLDKAPMNERIEWTINNTARIQDMVEVPLKDLWWTKADKPFLFLAACMELARVSGVDGGPATITRLPVSFDGSCSGLQHLSAMTRDETTASLVNLTRGERPSDVYAVIAEDTRSRVSADDDELGAKFLALGIDRKLAKRNVMTYSYSSKKFGMAAQQQVDLLDELYKDVLRKKIDEHPFGQNRTLGPKRPSRAARFIAGHIFDAIESRIHRPAEAMKFLQSIAKVMAHEGKPVRWTTPVGIPWVNRYHEPIMRRLQLFMWDRGVRTPHRMMVAVGNHAEIAKDKAANGVAPNFVHACDGSHLMLVVNAAAAVGITNVATVHDSFGCLASRAGVFNQIIRAELVRMYETHDVLSEVLEQAKCDLTQHNRERLPVVPDYGTLELKEIENAQYAFA